HHGALEMPPRCSRPPRRIPLHQPRHVLRRGSPEGEVGRVALARRRRDPSPLLKPLKVDERKLSVIGNLGGVEVKPGRDLVRVTLLLERTGKLDHFLDVRRSLRPNGWRKHTQL